MGEPWGPGVPPTLCCSPLQAWGPTPQKAAVQDGLTLPQTFLIGCFSTRAGRDPAPACCRCLAGVWGRRPGSCSSPHAMLLLSPASLAVPEPRAGAAETLCQAAGPQLSTGNGKAVVGTI